MKFAIFISAILTFVSNFGHANTHSMIAAQFCRSLFSNGGSLEAELISEGMKGMKASGIRPTKQQGRPEAWPTDGPDLNEEYLATFVPVLVAAGIPVVEDYFEKFVSDARSQRQHAHVLDVFGSGFFIKDPSLADSVTGVRFGPYVFAVPPERRTTEVLGDAFHPATWEKLDLSMITRNIPKFDLVALRPLAGWPVIDLRSSIYAFEFILANVLRRLDAKGHFYFEIWTTDKDVQDVKGNADLQRIVREIETRTPYKLVITSRNWSSISGEISTLDGVLLPKP